MWSGLIWIQSTNLIRSHPICYDLLWSGLVWSGLVSLACFRLVRFSLLRSVAFRFDPEPFAFQLISYDRIWSHTIWFDLRSSLVRCSPVQSGSVRCSLVLFGALQSGLIRFGFLISTVATSAYSIRRSSTQPSSLSACGRTQGTHSTLWTYLLQQKMKIFDYWAGFCGKWINCTMAVNSFTS